MRVRRWTCTDSRMEYLCKKLVELLGALLRGLRVLPGDELAVHDHVGRPVAHAAEIAAEALELILNEEGNHFGQGHGRLLRIGEARDALVLHDGLSVRTLDFVKRRNAVAHSSHGLSRCEEGL